MKNAKYPKNLDILLDSIHKSYRDSKSKKSSQENKFQLRCRHFSRGTVFFGTPCILYFVDFLSRRDSYWSKSKTTAQQVPSTWAFGGHVVGMWWEFGGHLVGTCFTSGPNSLLLQQKA